MGKLNPHSRGKIWENTDTPRVWVSTYFTWSRNPYNSQMMGGWVNSHITEQVLENPVNSLALLYLTDLELMKTHAILRFWECRNSHNTKIFCGKPCCSQAVEVWKNLRFFPPFYGEYMGILISFPLIILERFFLLTHTNPKTRGKQIYIE